MGPPNLNRILFLLEIKQMGNYNGRVSFSDCEAWLESNRFHREGDAPAVIYKSGRMCWYKYGELHRDSDKPADVHPGKYESWYVRGERHRDSDKPAIVREDGSCEWFVQGKLHRVGGEPAMIRSDGTRIWATNDRFVRSGSLCIALMSDGACGFYDSDADKIRFDNGIEYHLAGTAIVKVVKVHGDDESTSIDELKCVVCLDHKKRIFFSCGHVCCCGRCSKMLTKCPLCRVDIQYRAYAYI